MHPIEHLRYVARARGAEPAHLARETAQALATLRADPANLVVAARRIVGRHPEAAQLWWLCSHLLVADDASALAWELCDRFDDDPVADRLDAAIAPAATVVTIGNPLVVGEALCRRPDLRVWCADSEYGAADLLRRLDRNEVAAEPVATEQLGRALSSADVALIEARAVCAGRVLAPVGSQVLAAVARSVDTPVWLVAPTGTCVPVQYVAEIARRVLGDDGWEGSIDDVPPDLVDAVVTDRSPSPSSVAAVVPDCPFAPELLRTGVI